MTTKHSTMTAKQFNAALNELGLTPYAAAALLGVSLRTSHRYAAGDSKVPRYVALLLAMYLEHGLPSHTK